MPIIGSDRARCATSTPLAAQRCRISGGASTQRRLHHGVLAPHGAPVVATAPRDSSRTHVGRWGSGPGHGGRAIAGARYAWPRPAGLKNGTRGRRRLRLALRRGQRLVRPGRPAVGHTRRMEPRPPPSPSDRCGPPLVQLSRMAPPPVWAPPAGASREPWAQHVSAASSAGFAELADE